MMKADAYSFYEGLGWQCHLKDCGRLFKSEDDVKRHIEEEHPKPREDVYGRPTEE